MTTTVTPAKGYIYGEETNIAGFNGYGNLMVYQLTAVATDSAYSVGDNVIIYNPDLNVRPKFAVDGATTPELVIGEGDVYGVVTES